MEITFDLLKSIKNHEFYRLINSITLLSSKTFYIRGASNANIY